MSLRLFEYPHPRGRRGASPVIVIGRGRIAALCRQAAILLLDLRSNQEMGPAEVQTSLSL